MCFGMKFKFKCGSQLTRIICSIIGNNCICFELLVDHREWKTYFWCLLIEWKPHWFILHIAKPKIIFTRTGLIQPVSDIQPVFKHSHSFLAIRICNLAIFPTVQCAGNANEVLIKSNHCFPPFYSFLFPFNVKCQDRFAST